MLKHILLPIAFLVATCAFVNGQIRSLEFLLDPSEDGGLGLGATIIDSAQNLSPLYNTAKKVCVKGVWAFYDAPGYGVGSNAASVTSARISGVGPNDCVIGATVESIIKGTRSIRALGKKPFELYPLTHYLAERENDIITDPNNLPTDGDLTSFSIGSLIINDAKSYIICGEKKSSCICAPKGIHLAVDDVAKFPAKNPIGKLRRIQAASTPALQKECDSLPAPKK